MSAQILHHADDGTEGEYWWIQDGPGQDGIIGIYDTLAEAEAALGEMHL